MGFVCVCVCVCVCVYVCGSWETQRISKTCELILDMKVVPKVMSNFFFACELGIADEGECGGRWNQLLCYL